MAPMAEYDAYAKFYDATQGPSFAEAHRVLLEKYAPAAGSLLEIACGTGVVLSHLAPSYKTVAGLDSSRAMLREARRKLPHARFHHQDMTQFRLDRTFDAVICPYDALNHLLRFGDWRKTFKAVRRHLAPGGVFVFDMNTEFRLAQLAAAPAGVQDFPGGTMAIDVADEGRGVVAWRLRIFEKRQGQMYRLHRDSIEETAFHLDRVREALRREFREVRAFDAQGFSRPKRMSRRLYWVSRA